MPSDTLVSFTTNIFSWEGSTVANKLQIRGTQRARVTKLAKLIGQIQADDAKPVAKSAKLPKVKVLDDTVIYVTPTVKLTDFAANIVTRCNSLLAK